MTYSSGIIEQYRGRGSIVTALRREPTLGLACIFAEIFKGGFISFEEVESWKLI